VLESDQVANHTQDDGFHEIQLNGKQLVFVFMAAALLSVVIFLLGVLVGRDVQRGRVVLAETDEQTSPAAADPGLDPARPVVPPTVPPGADPTRADPPPPAGEGSAASTSTDAPDAARPAAVSSRGRDADAPPATAAATPAAAAKASPPARPADSAPPKPTATTGDGPQSGWVVQVASVDKRADADSIARRLTDKGYAAFVVESGPNRFRVRVGSFTSRSDADATAAKLRRDERIEPWVTR
jgi:cell division septation protein DedD